MIFKDYLYFVIDSAGRSYGVTNGVVSSSPTPLPLKATPDGWKDILIGWERDMDSSGLTTMFSFPLGFVLDGRQILSDAVYKKNIEQDLQLLIQKFKMKVDDQYFYPKHWYFYKAPIDLSTFSDDGTKATVKLADKSLAGLLKQKGGTAFTFPIDDDLEAEGVKLDGLSLQQAANYIVTEGATTDTNGQHLVNLNLVTTETVNAIGALNVDRRRFTDNANLAGSLDYFLKTGVDATELTIDYKINCTISLATGITPNPTASSAWIIRGFNDAGVAVIAPTIVEVGGSNNLYQKHIVEGSTTISVPANTRLYFICVLKIGGVIATGSSADGSVFWNYDNEDGYFNAKYAYRHRTTFVKGYTPEVLLNKLTSKAINTTAVSELLKANDNLLIIPGEALRGLKGAKLKTSYNDFFQAIKVLLNAGAGIENDKLVIEDRGHFYDASNPIPLGKVKNFKRDVARDLLPNTIKVGYNPKDISDVNGRYEFNNTSVYSTTYTDINKELSLICPYITQPYYIEVRRINLDGKTTTDSEVDSEVFVINTEKVAHTGTATTASFVAPLPMTPPPLRKHFIALVTTDTAFEELGAGMKITVTGSQFNNKTFTVKSVGKSTTGYTITVYENVVGELLVSNVSISFTSRILKRVAYDEITGVPYPDSLFNIEGLTPARLLEINKKYINSFFNGFDGQVCTFEPDSTSKNTELRTVKALETFVEKADYTISGDRYFLPIYFEFEPESPSDLAEIIENTPNRCFSFEDEDGNLFKGFLVRAGIAPNSRQEQTFKLLSSPDNDLSKLI